MWDEQASRCRDRLGIIGHGDHGLSPNSGRGSCAADPEHRRAGEYLDLGGDGVLCICFQGAALAIHPMLFHLWADCSERRVPG